MAVVKGLRSTSYGDSRQGTNYRGGPGGATGTLRWHLKNTPLTRHGFYSLLVMEYELFIEQINIIW